MATRRSIWSLTKSAILNVTTRSQPSGSRLLLSRSSSVTSSNSPAHPSWNSFHRPEFFMFPNNSFCRAFSSNQPSVSRLLLSGSSSEFNIFPNNSSTFYCRAFSSKQQVFDKVEEVLARAAAAKSKVGGLSPTTMEEPLLSEVYKEVEEVVLRAARSKSGGLSPTNMEEPLLSKLLRQMTGVYYFIRLAGILASLCVKLLVLVVMVTVTYDSVALQAFALRDMIVDPVYRIKVFKELDEASRREYQNLKTPFEVEK